MTASPVELSARIQTEVGGPSLLVEKTGHDNGFQGPQTSGKMSEEGPGLREVDSCLGSEWVVSWLPPAELEATRTKEEGPSTG